MSTPSQSFFESLNRRALAAVVASLWLVGLDRLQAGLAKLESTLALDALVVLASGALLAQLLGVVLLQLIDVAGAPLRRSRPRWVGPALGLLFAAALAWPFAKTGASLASGDWISKQSWAGQFRWGLTLGGVFGGLITGWLHARYRRRKAWGAALLAASLGCGFADATVLPGLYAPFHLTLLLLAGAAAFLGFQTLVTTVRHRPPRWLVVVPLVAAVAAGVALKTWGAKARPGLLLGSPMAATVMPAIGSGRGAALLRLALESLDLDAPPAEIARPQTASRPPNQLNLILIVVDTLRFDALQPARGSGTAFAQPGDTPFLDRWIKEGVQFTRAYAQATRTMFSMPAMFRSLHPFEDAQAIGRPIGSLMAARHRVPVAVTPRYFLMPMDKKVEGILDGFADVAFVAKKAQAELLPKARQMLTAHKGAPFFAWLHLYTMHAPGWADGRLLTRKDGDAAARYRRALRETDTQLKALHGLLGELGLLENSVIVLASDHGESLGEQGRKGHGASVKEREIRVPLVLWIPGQAPRTIDATVGNIDIVPTLLDAIGSPPNPSLRGRSLLRLLDGAPWDGAYASQNGSGRIQALVHGTDKLEIHVRSGTILRFDLKADPGEIKTLYDPNNPVDQGLVRRLLMGQPRLAKKELQADDAAGEALRALLSQKLLSVDASQAKRLGGTLSFMLGLVALDPKPALMAHVRTLFDGVDDATRLRIIEALPPGRFPVVRHGILDRLAAARGTAEARDLLDAMAAQGQPAFAIEAVALAIRATAKAGDKATLRSWLRLVRGWHKPSRIFGAAMSAALDLMGGPDASAADLRLLYGALSKLRIKRGMGRLAERLAAAIEPHLEHPDPFVGVEAALALKSLNRKHSVPPLIAILREGVDARTRQAAMKALARIEGPKAIEHLIRQGAEPLLTVDAIKLLGAMGSRAKAALPWLRKQSGRHPTAFGRRQAKKAVRRISGKRAKKRKKKPAKKKPAKKKPAKKKGTAD